MGTTAKSRFEVLSGDQVPLDDVGCVQVTRMNSTQRLQGDIEGDAAAECLLTHPGENYASIIGVFRVSGSIAGRSGTFVLQSSGTFENGKVRCDVVVVPKSGTGELDRLQGQGEYLSTGEREGALTLEYMLD